MNQLHRHQLNNYIFWAVVMGLIVISGLIILPFVGAIIAAYILAYFVRPMHLVLRWRGFSNWPAALLCVVATVIVIIVPIALISIYVLDQLGGVSSSQEISTIVDAFVAQPLLKDMGIDTIGIKEWINSAIDDAVNSTIQAIPSSVISIVVILNGMFYLLCNWEALGIHLKRYLPFKDNEKMIAELDASASAIIHSSALLSLLEAIIAFIGFTIFGVQGALVFSVIIFILAFAPSVGPDLVWIPLAIYYFSIHQYVTMVGVVITGLIMMVGVEFLLYSRYVGSKAHVHPFIMLIGIIGGLMMFGIFGFIIGPLILVIAGIMIKNKAVDDIDREIKGKRRRR